MTQAIKASDLTFKKTEAEWKQYHNTLKEIASLREEIMNPFEESPIDQSIVAGANSVRMPGDPTNRIATRLTTNKQLRYLEEITHAVEQVYNALPDEYRKMVRISYWSKSRDLTWEGVALELNLSEKQVRRRRKEIIQATIELLGWR